MKQHRTGATLVTLHNPPWQTSSATGRAWVGMTVMMDGFHVKEVAEGGPELARISNEIREAAKEALKWEDHKDE